MRVMANSDKSDVESAKATNLQLEPSHSLEENRKEDEEWEKDPNNAHNWSLFRKWIGVVVVSVYATMPAFAISMIAPALSNIAERFHVHNPTIRALVLSVTLLTYSFGPLVLAPLSEMYGRVPLLIFCSILSIVLNLGCAFSPSVGTLIAFRALYGFIASASPDIAAGFVSDMFPSKDRPTPMAVYHLGAMIGPFMGPILGGFSAQTIGSQWIFILNAAFSAGLTLFGLILLRETYAPVIRMRQATRENNEEKAARVHPMLLDAHADLVALLRINLTRPLVLLFQSPICFMLSLVLALMDGLFYVRMTSISVFFSGTYRFKPGFVGLVYSGICLGAIFSVIVGGKWASYVYNYLAYKNAGKGKPEMRMPSIIPGSILVAIGLFWCGWSAQAKLHWIMPIIGSAIFAFGLMTAVLGIKLYLADAFTYSASALAAASVFRSIFGFGFPLFGPQLYDVLGQGGGNSLLAGLAILFGIPIPIFIYYKGEAIRVRSSWTIDT